MGFPDPSLSLSQVYKSALAVRSMSVLASGNFPFSVPEKLAHGRGKKARNLFPSFSPVSCFLGLVPFLCRLPPFYLAKPGKSFRVEYLHGRRDSSRRRMTRARPSPSRLHLLPAMRLLSHLLPTQAQGRLLAKIHAKKKIATKSERELKIYTSKRQYVLMNESFMSYLFVVQRTLYRNVAERNYRSKS